MVKGTFRKLKNEELGRKSIEEYRQAHKFPVIVILDNVRSLHNIGSVFRTADGFLAEAVFLCGITACPPHREIRKTALGATESVPWQYFEHTAEAVCKLRNEGYTILSVEQAEGSIPLDKFQPDRNSRYALIFGHEVKGVAQEIVDISDYCVEIPQFGTKHSFNISVSAGIVLWDFYLKIKE
ncbi:MAG: RNA methyltransferase [Bacteroidales bacterium]|nr:RNA methyltransferase [Bacteroidales bacterium]